MTQSMTSHATAWRSRKMAAILSLLLAVGIFAPAHVLSGEQQQATATIEPLPAPDLDERIARSPADPDDLRQALAVSRVFQDVARAIGPSVVHITTEREVQRRQMPERMSPFGGPDPFEEFFERFFGPRRQFQQPEQQPQEPQRQQVGQASGLVVSRDGHIVTNYHVIAIAETVQVRMSNGREYEATVVGTDAETDLAVLKIEPDETLMPATFGDSNLLNPGEWVIAVGSALGLENTVTTGVVSATGRQVGIIRDQMGGMGYEDFVQSDAAINPGNSGGPLLNLFGEVIGINTAIMTRTGGYMGIGFAIPSNLVEPVVAAIIDDGEVHRGYLGIDLSELTPDLAASYGFESTDAVLIAEVHPDTPAEAAGLRYGDIVLSIDGQRMRTGSQLRNSVAMKRPGTTVELEISRDGEVMMREVTLAQRPTAEEQIAMQERRLPLTQRLGMAVEEVPPHLVRQLGLREGGVIVTQVDRTRAAWRQGIRPNDIILSVGGRTVSNVSEFQEAIAEADLEQGVRLRIRRGAAHLFVILRLPQN